MSDLDLKELDRLEKRTLTGQVGFTPGLFHLTLDELDFLGDSLRPLLDLVEKMGEALTNVLDVPHEEGCQYPLGGLYVCTRDCFQRAWKTARAVLEDYRRAKGE